MVTVVEKKIAGKTFSLETGKIAKQASGSVIVKSGDSVVLCVVVEGGERPGIDFFPLMVDYREKMYSSGKIPGAFNRREGRPSTKETLNSRLIDRPIRPNFPNGYKKDVTVECQVLSYDPDHSPDVLAMIGASAALGISHIPYTTMLGAVRIGYIDGQLVVNPNVEQMAKSQLDLVVSGTKDSIMMVESEAKELSEETMLEALALAQSTVGEIVATIDAFVAKAGKPKAKFTEPVGAKDLLGKMKGDIAGLMAAFKTPDKHQRSDNVKKVKEQISTKLLGKCSEEDLKTQKPLFETAFGELKELAMRELIFSGTRCDGRDTKTVRPISIETSLLPRAHGSALFTRGETQAIVTTTLGTSRDSMLIDDLDVKRYDALMLHYNFPGFSVGEVSGRPGPGRREIGHGNLALRALKAVIPSHEEFPYTLRIVSDITESNGSSSMASVCGGSLALMDAGVPIKAAVAGIAMGLIKDGAREAIISDILGDEDHYGDMDFKVAGTRKGITALQMDIKIQGLSRATMEKAVHQAREGRMHILDVMDKALSAPRGKMSAYAPRIQSIKIDPELIGKLIGPGGKNIRSIQETSGAEVSVDDDGTVLVYAKSGQAGEMAMARIREVTSVPEVGKTYVGKVVSIKDFGAFVDLFEGTSGLLHISEVSDDFVKDINQHVKLGDEMRVVITAIDRSGKIRLVREAKYLAEQGSTAGDRS